MAWRFFCHARAIMSPPGAKGTLSPVRGRRTLSKLPTVTRLDTCRVAGHLRTGRRAAAKEHQGAMWRLSLLHAAGEGMPRAVDKALDLCQSLASKGHLDGMLLLGKLYARRGDGKTAQHWWKRAADQASAQADALLRLAEWRRQEPVAGAQPMSKSNTSTRDGATAERPPSRCSPAMLAATRRPTM